MVDLRRRRPAGEQVDQAHVDDLEGNGLDAKLHRQSRRNVGVAMSSAWQWVLVHVQRARVAALLRLLWDLSPLALYIFDVFSDITVTMSYYERLPTIFWVSVCIVLITPVCSVLFVLFVLRSPRARAYPVQSRLILFVCSPVLPLFVFFANYFGWDTPLSSSDPAPPPPAGSKHLHSLESNLAQKKQNRARMHAAVDKMVRESGMLFETVVQSIPQSILQFYAMLVLRDFDNVAVLSIALSVAQIFTKASLLCSDKYVYWKTLCTQSAIATDILAMFGCALVFFAHGMSSWTFWLTTGLIGLRAVADTGVALTLTVLHGIDPGWTQNDAEHALLLFMVTSLMCFSASTFGGSAFVIVLRYVLWQDGSQFSRRLMPPKLNEATHYGVAIVSYTRYSLSRLDENRVPLQLVGTDDLMDSIGLPGGAKRRVMTGFWLLAYPLHLGTPLVSGLVSLYATVLAPPAGFPEPAWRTSLAIVGAHLVCYFAMLVFLVLSYKTAKARNHAHISRMATMYIRPVLRIWTLMQDMQRKLELSENTDEEVSLLRAYIANCDRYRTRCRDVILYAPAARSNFPKTPEEVEDLRKAALERCNELTGHHQEAKVSKARKPRWC